MYYIFTFLYNITVRNLHYDIILCRTNKVFNNDRSEELSVTIMHFIDFVI